MGVKSAGGITIRSPMADLGEMQSISKYIATMVKFWRKKGSKAQFGICGPIRGRIEEMNKDQCRIGGTR